MKHQGEEQDVLYAILVEKARWMYETSWWKEIVHVLCFL